jgi:ribonuclease-3
VTRSRPGADAVWLEATLGIRLIDDALLTRALTHRSAGGLDNERLEFLGDAVLSFVMAELLFARFTEASEGDLSRYRSSLVSGEVLADVGESLNIGDHLRLGAGELKSGGFRRRSILADAVEALLGAVFVDGGLEAARGVIGQLWSARVQALTETPPPKDPKTQLQEWLQGRGEALPVYAVEQVSGPPHRQVFLVHLSIEALSIQTSGEGTTRRRAEQQAAVQALALIQTKKDVP